MVDLGAGGGHTEQWREKRVHLEIPLPALTPLLQLRGVTPPRSLTRAGREPEGPTDRAGAEKGFKFQQAMLPLLSCFSNGEIFLILLLCSAVRNKCEFINGELKIKCENE